MRNPFCQDFSTNMGSHKEFDGKFRGENWQISSLKLANFSPRFAVKPCPIYKPLKFSGLQNLWKTAGFVKIFC